MATLISAIAVTTVGARNVSEARATDLRTAVPSPHQSTADRMGPRALLTKPAMGHPSAINQLAGRVGVLKSQNANAHCTAFCLSKTLIATAGHCLRDHPDQTSKQPTSLQFETSLPDTMGGTTRSNIKTSPILGLVSGGEAVSFRTPIEADRDWAVLRLQKPVCTRGGLTIAAPPPHSPHAQTSPQTPLSVPRVATNKAGDIWLTTHTCQTQPLQQARTTAHVLEDFSKPERLLFHTCNPGPLASGTPILSQTASGPTVIAMHVGTYVRSRVLEKDSRIVERIASRPIANIAVRVEAFTKPVWDMLNQATLPKTLQNTSPADTAP